MPTFRAKYTPAEKKAFGRLLRKTMEEKGMSGAELARVASQHLPAGKTIGRDNISWYVNGRSMPTPVYLSALGKALDVDPQLLIPRAHSQAAGEPPPPSAAPEQDVRMSMSGDGTMHLMMNIRLPRDLGWQILQMIEDHKAGKPPRK